MTKNKRGGSPRTQKGILAEKIIKEFAGFMSNKSMARKLYQENPKVYENIEDARRVIRYYLGVNGESRRQHAIASNDFKLPESFAEKKESYTIPLNITSALVISDIHLPYHDLKALKVALKCGVENKVQCVIINGDLLDFHTISRFERDPNKRSLAQEIEAGKDFIKALRFIFPTQLIIWNYGNHDHRYKKYVYQKAPELLGIKELELDYIIGCHEHKIIVLSNDMGLTFGKLNIRHGHEFFGGGGVMPGRNYLLKAKDNILVSHVHRSNFYPQTRIDRSIIGGWSIGCLSELQPDYNINSEYNHGFALITKDKIGNFKVSNKMIINGVIYES